MTLHAAVLGAALLGVAMEAAAAGPMERDAGARAFQKCYACHSVDPVERGLPGPNLAGVVGRAAATVPDFDYSPAMVAAGRRGLVWTGAALDRFLADPAAAIPGTAMAFVGMKDATERRAVIEYLERTER